MQFQSIIIIVLFFVLSSYIFFFFFEYTKCINTKLYRIELYFLLVVAVVSGTRARVSLSLSPSNFLFAFCAKFTNRHLYLVLSLRMYCSYSSFVFSLYNCILFCFCRRQLFIFCFVFAHKLKFTPSARIWANVWMYEIGISKIPQKKNEKWKPKTTKKNEINYRLGSIRSAYYYYGRASDFYFLLLLLLLPYFVF